MFVLFIIFLMAAAPFIVFIVFLYIIVKKILEHKTTRPQTRQRQTQRQTGKQILEPQRLSKTRQNAPETTLEDYMVYGGECIHGEDIVKPTTDNKKIQKQVLKNEEGRTPIEETRTVNPVAENCKEMAKTKLDLRSAVMYKEILGEPISKRKKVFKVAK